MAIDGHNSISIIENSPIKRHVEFLKAFHLNINVPYFETKIHSQSKKKTNSSS